METFEIRNDHIELNKLLKVMGWASTGGHAKQLIQGGQVLRNDGLETRVRAKLQAGEVIELEGQRVRLVAFGEEASACGSALVPSEAQKPDSDTGPNSG